MCGLYSFRRSPEEVRRLFAYAEEPDFPPRPYVAPGSPIAIVREVRRRRQFALVRWGFIPGWTKELKPGKPLINARGETVLEKATFRNAIRRRRCLVPADGYYEWKGDIPGRKQPFHIQRPDKALFAFAGVWEHWQSPEGSEIETAAIITTAANADIAPIHDRMPVVIMPEHYDAWLDETVDAEMVFPLIGPAPRGFFAPEPTVMERPQRPAPKPTNEPVQGRLF